MEDRDYYEEIGHKKIQKMNELEEMRRVVKDLNRRYEEKKEELVKKSLINFYRENEEKYQQISKNSSTKFKALTHRITNY